MKWFTQKGFTLPEVLIAAALMGGVALVTAKLMGDQAKNQVWMVTEAEISKFVSLMENHLNNPKTCKDMLGSRTSSAAGTPIGVSGTLEPQLFNLNSATGPRPVAGETNYREFSIPDNGYKLQNSNVSPDSISELIITFQVKNKWDKGGRKDANGNLLIDKMIPVVVQKTSAGVIQECGPVLSDSNDQAREQMCKSLGGAAIWDETARTCTLQSVKCPYGQVAIRMTSLGGIICQPIESQINLSEFFDTSMSSCSGSGNSLRIEKDATSGKMKITCTTSTACSDACSCPGSMYTCESGVCVNRSSGSCIDGTYAKGDASCRYLCNGGFWSCPAAAYQIPTCP